MKKTILMAILACLTGIGSMNAVMLTVNNNTSSDIYIFVHLKTKTVTGESGVLRNFDTPIGKPQIPFKISGGRSKLFDTSAVHAISHLMVKGSKISGNNWKKIGLSAPSTSAKMITIDDGGKWYYGLPIPKLPSFALPKLPSPKLPSPSLPSPKAPVFKTPW